MAEKKKSIYRDTGLGLGKFIESGGIPAALGKVVAHIIAGDPYKQGAMLSPRTKKYAETRRTRGSYSSGGGKMVVAPKPSALDASLSSAPSKASRKQEPAPASFQKVASSNKDMSPKTNSDLNKMSQSKPAVSPPSNKAFGGDAPAFKTSTKAPVTNLDLKTSTKPKSGGSLSGLKSALTKKPTARGPSEYEQIMTDIQPSRKKRR